MVDEECGNKTDVDVHSKKTFWYYTQAIFQLKQANGVCLSDNLILLNWARISNEEFRRRTETHICHLDSNKSFTSQACLITDCH